MCFVSSVFFFVSFHEAQIRKAWPKRWEKGGWRVRDSWLDLYSCTLFFCRQKKFSLTAIRMHAQLARPGSTKPLPTPWTQAREPASGDCTARHLHLGTNELVQTDGWFLAFRIVRKRAAKISLPLLS